MTFLLDVNALLAYHYPKHVHHARLIGWVSRLHAERGKDDVAFATCPITELGFIRVGSGPAGLAVSVETARVDLRSLKSRENTLFIPGAVLIPDETPAPLMVREEGALSGWTVPLCTGTQPGSALWQ